MQHASKTRQQGFTLIEVLVVTTIVFLVFALSSINLGQPQVTTSLNTTVSSLVADIKSQQMLAMSGDQGSSTTAQQPQGLRFQSADYTLFAGATYSAGDANNFTIAMGQNVSLATTFPSATLLFAKGAGEVTGYTAGSNTITLTSSGSSKVITVSRFGAVTVN